MINTIWLNWWYWKAIGKQIIGMKLTKFEEFILEIK